MAAGGHVEKLGYYDIAHSLNAAIENLFAHGGVGGTSHHHYWSLYPTRGRRNAHEE